MITRTSMFVFTVLAAAAAVHGAPQWITSTDAHIAVYRGSFGSANSVVDNAIDDAALVSAGGAGLTGGNGVRITVDLGEEMTISKVDVVGASGTSRCGSFRISTKASFPGQSRKKRAYTPFTSGLQTCFENRNSGEANVMSFSPITARYVEFQICSCTIAHNFNTCVPNYAGLPAPTPPPFHTHTGSGETHTPQTTASNGRKRASNKFEKRFVMQEEAVMHGGDLMFVGGETGGTGKTDQMVSTGDSQAGSGTFEPIDQNPGTAPPTPSPTIPANCPTLSLYEVRVYGEPSATSPPTAMPAVSTDPPTTEPTAAAVFAPTPAASVGSSSGCENCACRTIGRECNDLLYCSSGLCKPVLDREAELSRQDDEQSGNEAAFVAGLSMPMFLAAVGGALVLLCCAFAVCFFVAKSKSAKKNKKGTSRRSRAHSNLSRSTSRGRMGRTTSSRPLAGGPGGNNTMLSLGTGGGGMGQSWGGSMNTMSGNNQYGNASTLLMTGTQGTGFDAGNHYSPASANVAEPQMQYARV